MDEIDVPSHFLCPISIQLMRDPVIVSTGITYDRESIEKWLFSCKHNTCPMTKQVLSDIDLTPNHTLRRLIQAWCTLNSSYGIERIPTPKPQIDKSQIIKLVNDAKNKSPNSQLKCLKRLKSIACGSERNKRCLEGAGVVEFLASIVKKYESNGDGDDEFKNASDEALAILYHLETSLKRLVSEDSQFVGSLTNMLEFGSYQSRAYSIMLLKNIFEAADPVQLINIKPEFVIEVVNVLRDQVSKQASKSALKLLVELCPWGRNRVKAVEAGAVSVLIELLLDMPERRECELVLFLMDQICGCAEGRSELLKHGAGLAVVSKKILRVSHVASDRGVKIISLISRFSANPKVLQEMMHVGVVTKLCLVLQVNCSSKTKARAKEVLRLHSRVWKNSSCIPPHLLSSYPS